MKENKKTKLYIGYLLSEESPAVCVGFNKNNVQTVLDNNYKNCITWIECVKLEEDKATIIEID